MEDNYRVLVVNPGSTSTKIAVFDNEKEIFSENVTHSAEKLSEFGEIQEQLDYRRETIEFQLEKARIPMSGIDIFAGRGGGLASVSGGTYIVNDRLVQDAARAASGAPHPAQLASQICASYCEKYGGKAYVVNPPDVDEYELLSRITGMKGLYRQSHVHALNHKEVAFRYCAEKGIKYANSNLIVCHIGGGISVAAHKAGKMVDSNDLLAGEGSMMPTRTGSLPAAPLIRLCFSGEYSEKQLLTIINKEGGLVAHLGTSDAREIEEMISTGNEEAKLVYDAMIYQVAKSAGALAGALEGRVDGIILTGGISHSRYVTQKLCKYLDWIAEVAIMPGEFEMEALAAGALRAVRGEEPTMTYTGIPVWTAG